VGANFGGGKGGDLGAVEGHVGGVVGDSKFETRGSVCGWWDTT
jgi:hypothetical protein